MWKMAATHIATKVTLISALLGGTTALEIYLTLSTILDHQNGDASTVQLNTSSSTPILPTQI
jgi:hypothetical protein